MEKGDWNRLLIKELTQGRDVSKQLQINLGMTSTDELRELLQKITSSFNNSLSMLKRSHSDVEPPQASPVTATDSPRSFIGSPRSENSDQDFKDNERREISKKRKTLPKWTEQVRVSSVTGLEGPVDDGYSWRKYGQKDILGAKFPRAYYRCTHRNVHGCLATKQVQRSDENPSILDVTYRGRHTCIQASHVIPASTPPEKQEKQQQPQMLLNFRMGLKVKTADLDNQELTSPSFSFPSPSIDDPINSENHIFSTSILDNSFMGSFSAPFVSPATSESNYFSLSPSPMNSCGLGANLQGSESDLTEIISAANSASSSPMLDLDFMLGGLDEFPFDDNSFLS